MSEKAVVQKRRFVALIAICVIVSVLYCMVYLKDNRMIRRISIPEDAVNDADQYLYGIDYPYKLEHNYLTLTGYAVRRDENLDYINNTVVLMSEDKKDCFAMNTVAQERGLTGFFNTGYDYSDGGLIAVGDISEIRRDMPYEVYILTIDHNNQAHLLDSCISVDLSQSI